MIVKRLLDCTYTADNFRKCAKNSLHAIVQTQNKPKTYSFLKLRSPEDSRQIMSCVPQYSQYPLGPAMGGLTMKYPNVFSTAPMDIMAQGGRTL